MKTGDYKKIAKKHGCRLGKIKRLGDCCREIRISVGDIKEGDVFDGTYWDKWNPYSKEDLGDVKEMVIVIKAEGTKYQDSIVQELIPMNKLTAREKDFLQLQKLDKDVFKTIAHYLKFIRDEHKISKPKEKKNPNPLEKILALPDSVLIEPTRDEKGKLRNLNSMISIRGGVTVIIPNLMFDLGILVHRGKNRYSWAGKEPDVEMAYSLWDANNNVVQKKYQDMFKKEKKAEKQQLKINNEN